MFPDPINYRSLRIVFPYPGGFEWQYYIPGGMYWVPVQIPWSSTPEPAVVYPWDGEPRL